MARGRVALSVSFRGCLFTNSIRCHSDRSPKANIFVLAKFSLQVRFSQVPLVDIFFFVILVELTKNMLGGCDECVKACTRERAGNGR